MTDEQKETGVADERHTELTNMSEELHTQFVRMEALRQEVQRLNALTKDLLAMVGEMSLGGKPKGRVEVKRVRGQSKVDHQLAAALTEGWEIITFNQFMEGPKDKKALTYDIWLKRFVPNDTPLPIPTPPTPPANIPPKHERPGHQPKPTPPAAKDKDGAGDDKAVTLIMPEDTEAREGDALIMPGGEQRRSWYPTIPEWKQYITPEEKKIISDINRKAQMRCSLANDRAFGEDNRILAYALGEENIG